MITASAASVPTTQAELIRQATLAARHARNRYTDQIAAQLTSSLADASGLVQRSILNYRTLGSLPDNKLAALKGLEKLRAEIRAILATLRKEQTVLLKGGIRTGFRNGIAGGIRELAEAALPFYRDLTTEGIDKLATRVFQIVDTDALDFMSNYTLVLAGDVQRELAVGIQRTILSGIATGKGSDSIVRDLGHVVKDKEAFRHAGGRVFRTAQQRMETISRTEVLRAHNQGRLKFHDRVGVRQLEWMTMEDERVCPVCGPLDGKVYPTGRFPQQPAHPNCRCCSVVTKPLVVCGGELGAVAAAEPAPCLVPPQALEQQAKAKAAHEAKLQQAFQSGETGPLQALTVKDLQTLAKKNGVSVARTKADHLKLLAKVEPGVDHSGLGGQALQAKLKAYKIGALRNKDELAYLLAEKQKALVQAQQVAKELAGVPSPTTLEGLTKVELQDLAKEKGISVHLTKADVIGLLDELEPGIDHSGLAGKQLAAAKKKHGIGPWKSKKQLAAAIEKAAGQELAEKAKQEALEAAQKKAVQAAQDALEQATAKVLVPANPAEYSGFLEAVKGAEAALGKAGPLPQALLQEKAKELAFKKALFKEQLEGLTAAQLKTIAKETKLHHWQWSTKGDLVVLFSETDAEAIAATKAAIEAKWAKWAAKHASGKKKPKAAPAAPTLPKPQVSVPGTKTPVPAPPAIAPKPGSAFQVADQAWTERGLPSRFKYDSKANVGGAHAKEFWIDDEGQRWLFKPVAAKDELVALGEEAAYKVGRLIDPDAIEVRTIRLKGRLGSVQRWRTDLDSKFDFDGFAVADLSRSEIEQVQREHVLDWLVSNHDGHRRQFLRGKDGHVWGIDKGQAFKHLGDDRLSIGYHPNARYGEEEPFYNRLFRAVKTKEVDVDPAVTLRAIQQIERLPDEDYLAMLRAYADARYGQDAARKQAFLDLAVARKRGLRRDFEEYYADILGQRGFRFESAKAAQQTGRLGPAEAELLDEAAELGWQGKVLPFDEGDIEDQNALIFVETLGGKPRTVVKMKVRPEADKKLLAALEKHGIERAPAKLGAALPEDDFAADILSAVKTINHHAEDHAYNQNSLKKATGHRAALRRLAKSEDQDIREMAAGYLTWLDRIDEATEKQIKLGGQFEAYLKRYQAKPATKKSSIRVKQATISHPRRRLNHGLLEADPAWDGNGDLFGGSVKAGRQYEIELGDGIQAIYRPWVSQNPYAQQGELEILLPGRPKTATLETAMEKLEELGLSAGVATPEDAELLYLMKQAYVLKIDREPEYSKLVLGLDNRAASKEERVAELRRFWEKRLGVEDLTRMPGYAPVGEYQHGFRSGRPGAGFRHQYRFDISDEQLDKDMKGYALYHQVTGGRSIPVLLDEALENNGAMVSTIEKLRIGIRPGGMSPGADMDTGGGSYFFTRIKRQPSATSGRATAGIYFKKRLLRRMDAISYRGDNYGRVTGDHVRTNRGSTPSDWKAFARNSSNETILKGSVTLLDNLESIVVSSAAERKRVLAAFSKRGIDRLPDGREVGDIVLVR